MTVSLQYLSLCREMNNMIINKCNEDVYDSNKIFVVFIMPPSHYHESYTYVYIIDVLCSALCSETNYTV